MSEAFDVLSMGVGSDGTSGFPLVAVYLTGEELKARAFCHELDHLEGILFKAKASRMIDPSELETEEENEE